MTAGRQRRKLRFSLLAPLLAAVGSLFGPVAGAVLSEAIVVDRHSGLAISGFDPVAYFTEGRAEQGNPEYEAVVARATWRFRNEGSRAAFVAHPDVYMPQFGGYDPVA